jgi:putative ABC transport system permease protein
MSFLDLINLILDNIGRRKARVALTAIGVVIGTAAVVILISLAIGLQRNATNSLYGISDLSRIDVYPKYEYIEAVVVGGSGIPGPPPSQKLITDETLAQIAAIEGVNQVIPRDYMMGEAMIYTGRLETWAGINGVGGINDLSLLGYEAQSGTLVMDKNSLVIGAMIPSNFYDPKYRPGQEPPSPPDLLGQSVRLMLRKYDETGQPITKSYQLTVVGIIKENRGESDYSMYMPLDVITKYNEWFTGRRVNRNKDGYNNIVVRVADPKNVIDIAEQIKNLGYEAYTPQSFVQGINSFFVVLQIIFGGVGATALLVAAIGIANTMTMAILERTREIGLMKALGATNRDVLSVFLGEAAGIGFLGGLGGVVAGWSGGQIINVLALGYLAGQAAQQGGPPPSIAVYTPIWLPVLALVFATLVGLVSGLYPALRAASLVPINALKYE